MNPFEYVKYIQNKWAWASYCEAKWQKKEGLTGGKRWILVWELSTGGWSEHEFFISEMDKIFWSLCWVQHRRGGHYIFEVDPINWNFKLVNDYAHEKGISRQYIYQNPDKFEWVHVSKGVKFIKPL